MAIYSMNISVCVKSGSSGAGGAAINYQHREGKYDKAHSRDKVENSLVMVHDRPDINTGAKFANWVNEQEKTLKSNQTRILDKHILALPREFDSEQRLFVSFQYFDNLCKATNRKVSNVSIAIHNDRENNNPHAHISFVARDQEGLQVRPLTARVLDKKIIDRFNLDPSLKGKKSADLCREVWAKTVNDYAKKNGIGVTIDHRSFKDQGVERQPTKHVGPLDKTKQPDEYQQKISRYNNDIFDREKARKAASIKALEAKKQHEKDLDELRKLYSKGGSFDESHRQVRINQHLKLTENGHKNAYQSLYDHLDTDRRKVLEAWSEGKMKSHHKAIRGEIDNALEGAASQFPVAEENVSVKIGKIAANVLQKSNVIGSLIMKAQQVLQLVNSVSKEIRGYSR